MQTAHHYYIMLGYYQSILEAWKHSGRTSQIQKPLLVKREEVADYLPPEGFAYLPDWVREFPMFVLVNDNADGTWSDWVEARFPKAKSHKDQALYDWVEEKRENAK